MSKEAKPKISEKDALQIVAYKHASELDAFVDLMNDLYRSCRSRARESFEKNDSVASYWSGRADSYEALLDNMNQSKTINLSKFV